MSARGDLNRISDKLLLPLLMQGELFYHQSSLRRINRLPLVKEIPLLGEMSAKRTKGSAASARRAQTDKKMRDCTKLFERSEYLILLP